MAEENPYRAPGTMIGGKGAVLTRRLVRWAWFGMLAVCPVGLIVVEVVYPDVDSHPPPYPPLLPAERWVTRLWEVHFWASAVAAAMVVVVFRRWSRRVWAWVGLAVWLVVVMVWMIGTSMGKSGKYF